jgi:hypothetical protein
VATAPSWSPDFIDALDSVRPGGTYARNEAGETPLLLARGGRAKELLERYGGEKVGLDIGHPLRKSLERGDADAAVALVEAGADLSGGLMGEALGCTPAPAADFLSRVLAAVEKVGGTAEFMGSANEAGETVVFHIVEALAVAPKAVAKGADDDDEEEEEEDTGSDEDDAPLQERIARNLSKPALQETLDSLLDSLLELNAAAAALCKTRSLDGRTALHACVAGKLHPCARKLVAAADSAGVKKQLVGMADRRGVTAGALAAKIGETKLSIMLHNSVK